MTNRFYSEVLLGLNAPNNIPWLADLDVQGTEGSYCAPSRPTVPNQPTDNTVDHTVTSQVQAATRSRPCHRHLGTFNCLRLLGIKY